ncbi:hypothetical protein EZ313_04615 [Ramlibacter henchirensis]|uniref:Lipoprotein n=1 Tax=Ramlibacter henchirensis TaxID=204072 RepID=A0A4Z0C655_9BURK|nr:hypothetical protein [Ramlibacter henchirensis]TFZ05940.1 hypothetical protein EZ313_04615 [Ramlibacter henchirensis]
MSSNPRYPKFPGVRRWRASLGLALPLAALLAGCAAQPTTTATAAPRSCPEIAAEIANTQGELAAARNKEQHAWRAVIPFAVVGRYVSGKAAAGQAQQRMEVLNEQYAKEGCERRAA